jgi:hypothetical protein
MGDLTWTFELQFRCPEGEITMVTREGETLKKKVHEHENIV